MQNDFQILFILHSPVAFSFGRAQLVDYSVLLSSLTPVSTPAEEFPIKVNALSIVQVKREVEKGSRATPAWCYIRFIMKLTGGCANRV